MYQDNNPHKEMSKGACTSTGKKHRHPQTEKNLETATLQYKQIQMLKQPRRKSHTNPSQLKENNKLFKMGLSTCSSPVKIPLTSPQKFDT